MMCDVLSLCLGSLIEIVVLFTYITCYFQENLKFVYSFLTFYNFRCNLLFFSEGRKLNPTIVLSSSFVEPDNTSWRKKRKSAKPECKSASASSKDKKGEIIDVKKPERVKVKSEEPVKKRTTRSSSKKIKKEESDIKELPPVIKSHNQVLIDDDEVERLVQ